MRSLVRVISSQYEMSDGTSIAFTSLTFQRGGVEVVNHEGIVTLKDAYLVAYSSTRTAHLHKIFGGGLMEEK